MLLKDAVSHLLVVRIRNLKKMLLKEVVLSLGFTQIGTFYGAYSFSSSIVFLTFAPQHNTPINLVASSGSNRRFK